MTFDVQAAAQRLLGLSTTSQIRTFRAGLSKEQAQQVIRSLTPVQRGAILLAIHFGGEPIKLNSRWSRWETCDAAIFQEELNSNDDP